MGMIFAKLLEEDARQQQQLHPPQTNLSPQVDSTTARQPDGMTVPRQAVTTAGQPDGIHRQVRGYLAVKATQKTTLRYPVELMDDLEEIIYQLKRSQHVLVSKNEIFVLALGYIVADFRQQGGRSWLVQELVETPQVDSTTA